METDQNQKTVCITDSQDEQSFEEIFRDADQIHVPIFQRQYVWDVDEFKVLATDINSILATLESSQFLGAVVAYQRRREVGVFGRMLTLDVVDGQQRLMTLFLLIMGVGEQMFQFNPELAADIIQSLLLTPRKGLEVNTKIVPALVDRLQFKIIWDRINSPELMREVLKDNPPYPPLPSGPNKGQLIKQYDRINRWLKSQMPPEPSNAINYLKRIFYIINTNLTFVVLKLADPAVATKVFERFNARGVKVSIADLVKNEVFSKSDQDPKITKYIHETVWAPFESKFDGTSEKFYFPYCLTFNSNFKKSELFIGLRTIWKDLSPEGIVAHMEPYQKVFIAIHSGVPHFEDQDVNKCLKKLNESGLPLVVYPFLMKLLVEYDAKRVGKSPTTEILKFIESFLVRKALLGHEPTGLHALFKGMWNDLDGDITVEALKERIKSKPTILFPYDSLVSEAIKIRPIAKSKICKFLLREYDRSLPGDTPNNEITIEHILPQTYKEDSPWAMSFTVEQHKQLKDVFANLIPLSGPLNSSIQDAAYNEKRRRYIEESMFVTPRYLSKAYEEWTPETIEIRSNELANWALNRWKI